MADPTNQHLYRVGPGTGKWISYSELLLLLAHWNLEAPGAGVPSLTISKDTREPTPASIMDLKPTLEAAGATVVTLGTPCPECGHSYNWHLGVQGCQSHECLCDGFPR